MKTAAERARQFRSMAELGFRCAREGQQKANAADTEARRTHYRAMAAAFKREAEADAAMARHWEARAQVEAMADA